MTRENVEKLSEIMRGKIVDITVQENVLTGLWKRIEINSTTFQTRIIIEIKGVDLIIPSQAILDIKLKSEN